MPPTVPTSCWRASDVDVALVVPSVRDDPPGPALGAGVGRGRAPGGVLSLLPPVPAALAGVELLAVAAGAPRGGGGGRLQVDQVPPGQPGPEGGRGADP